MKDFIKGVFSEADGTPSFGRCATGVTIASVLLFIGAYLKMARSFPTYDILLALSVLMTAPYGTNKMAEAISNIKDIITSKSDKADVPKG